MLRTSGVSSGATSGSSGSNPAYWRPAQPAAAAATARADQRKFSTLSRAQQQQQQRGKSSQVLRTRSFQVGNSGNSNSKLSCFSPSENSAFHCISANNNRGEAAQLSQSQVRQRTVISILTLVLRRIRR